MVSSKSTKNSSQGKTPHPQSRKADQLVRSQLRKSKLASALAKRGQKYASKAGIYSFFYHSLPEEGVLSLDDLHALVKDIWLTRHDAELEEERSARRKGRPKSAKETKIEELKLREIEEYRTGMDIPDLTHPETIQLFRRWDQKELAFIQLLRFIRIFRDEPQAAVVTQPGQHMSLLESEQSKNSAPSQ